MQSLETKSEVATKPKLSSNLTFLMTAPKSELAVALLSGQDSVNSNIVSFTGNAKNKGVIKK